LLRLDYDVKDAALDTDSGTTEAVTAAVAPDNK